MATPQDSLMKYLAENPSIYPVYQNHLAMALLVFLQGKGHYLGEAVNAFSRFERFEIEAALKQLASLSLLDSLAVHNDDLYYLTEKGKEFCNHYLEARKGFEL